MFGVFRTQNISAPSPFNPTDDVSAQSKGIRRIQQSLLRPLKHIPLIHKIVQHFPPLCYEVIQLCTRGLREGVFTQSVLFSRL